MEKFLQFLSDYKYPIIGFVIALIFIMTDLYNLIVPIILLIAGVYFGFYFQKNKEQFKEKVKKFIDKL